MSNEKKFAQAYGVHWADIQEHLKQASKHLDSAKALADSTGLPFKTNLGVYIPDSFSDEFIHIDPNFVEILTDIASWQIEDACGWRASSANC